MPIQRRTHSDHVSTQTSASRMVSPVRPLGRREPPSICAIQSSLPSARRAIAMPGRACRRVPSLGSGHSSIRPKGSEQRSRFAFSFGMRPVCSNKKREPARHMNNHSRSLWHLASMHWRCYVYYVPITGEVQVIRSSDSSILLLIEQGKLD